MPVGGVDIVGRGASQQAGRDATGRAPEGSVLSVAFSPDGKTLAAGMQCERSQLRVVLWDVDAKRSWPRCLCRSQPET